MLRIKSRWSVASAFVPFFLAAICVAIAANSISMSVKRGFGVVAILFGFAGSAALWALATRFAREAFRSFRQREWAAGGFRLVAGIVFVLVGVAIILYGFAILPFLLFWES